MGGSTQKNIRLQAVIIKEGLCVAVEQQAGKQSIPTGQGQRTSRLTAHLPKRCGTDEKLLDLATAGVWRWIRAPLESLGMD